MAGRAALVHNAGNLARPRHLRGDHIVSVQVDARQKREQGEAPHASMITPWPIGDPPKDAGFTRRCSNGEMESPTKVRPFMMFQGKAEEAMKFYVSLFPGSEIVDIVRYGPGEAGAEGSVKKAAMSIGRQSVLCTDSLVA